MKTTSLLRNFLMGTAIAFAIGADPIQLATGFAAVGAGFSILFRLMGWSVPGFMASVIDIDDLVTEYGAYYKNDGDRRKKLRNKLYNTGNKFDDHFMTVPTDNTREEFTYSEHSEVLQPWQVGWTPKGDHEILPNVAQLFWAKMDLDYVPDHLVLSHAGWLRANDLDVSKSPFIDYVIFEHILPKAAEDWYLNVAFKGAYAAPTPGTAGAASTTADGVRELIRNKYADGIINPFDLGAPPEDPVLFCKYMEDFAARLPEQHRGKKMSFRMDEALRLRYVEGFNELHNKFFLKLDGDINSLPIYQYPNLKVEGFENMGGSNMIFIAEKSNSWKLVKGGVKKEILKVETLKRQVFLFTDYHAGYFFPQPNEVWVNDQDLTA